MCLSVFMLVSMLIFFILVFWSFRVLSDDKCFSFDIFLSKGEFFMLMVLRFL